MSKILKKRKLNYIIYLLILAIMCITIGYASINSIVLNITGTVEAKVQKGVFIIDIEYVSDIDAIKDSNTIGYYTGTTMQSRVMLSNENPDSEIIYKVTIYNNSEETKSFLDVVYDKEFYDNENIVYEILDSGFKQGDEIAKNEKKDIYIKFKYKDKTLISNNILNSYINFKLGKPNMLAIVSSSGEFFNTVDRTSIEKISFELAKIPENVTQTFDASAKKDKSITGYVTDADSNGLYEITFSSTDPIYANTDSSYLFTFLTSLTSIEFNNFRTSQTTDMSYMFNYCKRLTNLDLSSFDTSNVTNMSYMFKDSSSLTNLDLSGFDTSKVTDMSYMFYLCYGLTSIDVSKFDTSKVTNMYAMFLYCKRLTNLDLSKFDTSNVTDMCGMFNYCSSLTSIDVSKFDTSNVTDMGGMFNYCSGLTSIDVSKFDTSNVTDMSSMFYSCSGLKTIYASDKFVTTAVTSSTNMFYNCTSLVGENGTTYNSSYVDATYARIDTEETLGYFSEKKNHLKRNPVSSSTFLGMGTRSSITKVIFENTTKNAPSTVIDVSETENKSILGWLDGTEAHISSDGKIYANEDSSSLFEGLKNCTEIENLNLLNTSNVTNMYEMFNGCARLTSIDVSNFDTSNVTYIVYMFELCSELKTIYTSDKFVTDKATYSSSMFYNCSSLVGGNGTTYNSSYVDATYARIDGGPSSDTPGYFTLKETGE